MSNYPLVSIILPIYNSEKYIRNSIGSIISQTYINWELLIIYDESIDNSLQIIKFFLSKDNRIKILFNKNKGLKNALNFGILKSKGKYIARMDGDDISYPNRINYQLKYMINKKLDICGSHYNQIDEKGIEIKTFFTPVSHENCFIRLVSAVPFAHSSVMINKNFLERNKIRYWSKTINYPEDLDLWIKMYNLGAKFGNIDKILIKYRVWKDSSSRFNTKYSRNISIKLYREFFNKNFLELSKIINRGIKSNRGIDDYYFTRLIFRFIILKGDFKGISRLKFNSFNSLLRAFFAEIKNYFIYLSIKKSFKKIN